MSMDMQSQLRRIQCRRFVFASSPIAPTCFISSFSKYKTHSDVFFDKFIDRTGFEPSSTFLLLAENLLLGPTHLLRGLSCTGTLHAFALAFLLGFSLLLSFAVRVSASLAFTYDIEVMSVRRDASCEQVSGSGKKKSKVKRSNNASNLGITWCWTQNARQGWQIPRMRLCRSRVSLLTHVAQG